MSAAVIEEYVAVSPPEFQKRAKAREDRKHHLADLTDFIDWLADEMQHIPLQDLSGADRRSLAAEYIQVLEDEEG